MALNDALDVAMKYRVFNFLIFSNSLSALPGFNSPIFSVKANLYIYEIKRKFVQFHLEDPHNGIKFY